MEDLKFEVTYETIDGEFLTHKEYKTEVIAQLKWLGATDKQIKADISDRLIRTQMLMNIHPHDLAWALMQ